MLNWLMFGALGLIWGSSFLLIKIGVDTSGAVNLDPFSFVAGRLAISAAAFAVLLLVTRRVMARKPRDLIKFAVVGLLNSALPFMLITWAETVIDSGLAGVLNATVPLFTLVIAHLALADDKINLFKLLGLISGFFGAVLLATRGINPSQPNPVEGQLAVLVAAVSYALGAVYVRKYMRGIEPTVVAGGSNIFGAFFAIIATLLIVNPLPDVAALPSSTIVVVIVIGLLNTFIAYLMYYRLLEAWGASRSTMVTYVTPPVALFLGVLVAEEQLDARLLIGAALIIGGVALANLPQFRAMLRQRPKVAVGD